MKEIIPLFNPDSADEDDVEMNDDESGTPYVENITPVPKGNATAGEVVLFRHISDNPLLKSGPFPQRASNIQEHRNDTEMDNNDGASHPESITAAPPQSTDVGAGTVALFHRNPDSPLFKHGTKTIIRHLNLHLGLGKLISSSINSSKPSRGCSIPRTKPSGMHNTCYWSLRR